MKKILFINLFLLITCGSFSQKSFPGTLDNPQWSVLECTYGIGYTCYTYQIEYAYDTVFCGNDYIKLLSNHSEYKGYVRIEGQKVFLRNSTNCMDKEYLLYDYSLNTGDTVYCGFMINYAIPLSADTTKFWVTQTDSIIYQGVKRKALLMNYYSYPLIRYGGYWIEGIGSTIHPFYPLACLEDFCEQSFNLLCYDSSGVLMYQSSQYQTCDTTIIVTEIRDSKKNKNSDILIFPNPTLDNLLYVTFLNNFSGNISLYNKQGYIIYSTDLNNVYSHVINTTDFSKGIYLIKFIFNNKIVYKKIIII